MARMDSGTEAGLAGHERTAPERAGRMRVVPVAVLVPAAALVWWVIGFLPWLTGSSLFFQQYRAGSMPSTTTLMLPLVSSALPVLVLCSATGGLLAGSLGMLARRGSRASIAGATFAGVAIAGTAAVVQAIVTISETRPGTFAGDPRVLGGLVVAVAAAGVLGWSLGACAILGRPGVGVALAVLAGLGPRWLGAALPEPAVDAAGMKWLGAGLLALALIKIGRSPIARLRWWPVACLLAWIATPAFTAVSYLQHSLQPGRALPNSLGEAFGSSLRVFWLSASEEMRTSVPWLLAVLVALLVAFVPWHRIVGRTRTARASSAG